MSRIHALLHVELLAAPRREVEAGTLLALTLFVENRSAAPARGAVFAVPIPSSAEYVEGTLFHDATRIAGDGFFGDGYEQADLQPAARSAFIWKLRVRDGDESLRIVPQVWAGETRVSGSAPVTILRREAAGCGAEGPEARATVTLYRELDRATRAYFDRAFGPNATPALLQHCLFGCALACALDADGRDAGKLKLQLDLQAQALHRLALAARANGGVRPDSARFLVDLDGLRTQSPHEAAMATDGDTLVLTTRLSEAALELGSRLGEQKERCDFLRAWQFALALQAQALHSPRAPSRALQVQHALQRYARVTSEALERSAMLARLEDATALLRRSEPELDDAARVLLAGLAAL